MEEPVVHESIQGFYEQRSERERLTGSHPAGGVLEFVRTQQILEAILPRSGRILDIGGGTGAYASWLAGLGYDVELIEPLSKHVEQAQEVARTGPPFDVRVGDARRLPDDDASADVVLLMGPLYHLVEASDRSQALAEARRVLRSGGLVVGAAIGRYAWLLDAAKRNLIVEEDVMRSVVASVATGMSNPEPGPDSFYAYFHRPDEFVSEISAVGFEDIDIVAVEGIGSLLPNIAERVQDPAQRQPLLELLETVGRDPTMLGLSSHLLAWGTRPEMAV